MLPLALYYESVSNPLRPHELYSSWNSPGQNTGVGSRWQNEGRLWMMTRTGQLWGTASSDSITGVPGQCQVGRPGKWKLLRVVCSVAASGPHCWWPWEFSLQRVPKEMHWLWHTPGLPRGALKWWTGCYFFKSLKNSSHRNKEFRRSESKVRVKKIIRTHSIYPTEISTCVHQKTLFKNTHTSIPTLSGLE